MKTHEYKAHRWTDDEEHAYQQGVAAGKTLAKAANDERLIAALDRLNAQITPKFTPVQLPTKDVLGVIRALTELLK